MFKQMVVGLLLLLTGCAGSAVKQEELNTFNKEFAYIVNQYTALIDTANAMVDGGIIVPGDSRYKKLDVLFKQGQTLIKEVMDALTLKDIALAKSKEQLLQKVLLDVRKTLVEGDQHARWNGRTECYRCNTVWA